MKLTVIGCSGSFAGPDSVGQLLPARGADADDPSRTWRLLLDLGSGALGALQRHVDPLTIDAVLISHLHADHFFDISGYYVMRKYHPRGPQPQHPGLGPARHQVRASPAPTGCRSTRG